MPATASPSRGSAGVREHRGGGAARDLRPLLLAATVAVASCGLLAVAVVGGWLGPDVGRGSNFCEAARSGLIRQPANTLSNVGFVLAGLLIAWRAGSPRTTIAAHPGLATAYGVLVVLLGPASAAMHATQSVLGGHLDMLSMYLVASFASAYAAMRLLRSGAAVFVAGFVAAMAACLAAEGSSAPVPVIDTAGNLVFALLLLVAVGGEIALRSRGRSDVDLRWGAAAVGSLLLAFGIWNLSKNGRPWCDPHALLQGHAAWHLLCAVAAYALFRLYASEGRGQPAALVSR